jgi:hypothetical protein
MRFCGHVPNSLRNKNLKRHILKFECRPLSVKNGKFGNKKAFII